MKAKKDLQGKRFGRLLAIRVSGKTPGRHAVWKCICDCGQSANVVRGSLLRGTTISCGCLWKARIARGANLKHGQFGTPTYKSWSNMLTRCNNPKNPAFKNYGGRGIKVCERWKSFESFRADMGDKPDVALTIERKNNELGYFKENCKWATRAEQSMNTRRNIRRVSV